MFLKKKMKESTGDYSDKITELKEKISEADAVVIGAGSGLSTSAGFVYSGERFKQYFSDFEEKYDFHDMYSGGFYYYDTLEEYWAYWSRYIYINRYIDAPKPVYDRLLELVKDSHEVDIIKKANDGELVYDETRIPTGNAAPAQPEDVEDSN